LKPGEKPDKDDTGIEYVYQDIDRIIDIVDSLLA
jgi:hypothetical protein